MAMSFARSFPPSTAPNAEILILGSMPGQASLSANQYYAHPRNAFWPIMASLLSFDPKAPYDERVEHLIKARIAVWDVLQACSRPGSLDADIDSDSSICNDFSTFLGARASIKRIFFNGAKAESVFRKHVASVLKIDDLLLSRLPSTSPAHAALSLQDKLQAWKVIAQA